MKFFILLTLTALLLSCDGHDDKEIPSQNPKPSPNQQPKPDYPNEPNMVPPLTT